MPRSVYLILIILFGPFSLIHFHFLKVLLCLYCQSTPLFLWTTCMCLLAFAIFSWPCFFLKCHSIAPFPSPPNFWKVCSVLLALFRIPLLNCLHVDFYLVLLTFYISDWSPSNNASLWHLTPFQLKPTHLEKPTRKTTTMINPTHNN